MFSCTQARKRRTHSQSGARRGPPSELQVCAVEAVVQGVHAAHPPVLYIEEHRRMAVVSSRPSLRTLCSSAGQITVHRGRAAVCGPALTVAATVLRDLPHPGEETQLVPPRSAAAGA